MNQEEIKQVVSHLFSDFIKEEAGNRVTKNNMLGLLMNINLAVEGKISLTPPPEVDNTKIM